MEGRDGGQGDGMSGPKGGSYRVESAKQREERLLRDAKASYARAQSLWSAAQSKMETTATATGKVVNFAPPAPVRSGADSAAYTAAAAALEAAAQAAVDAAAAVRQECADARFAAQVARIAAASAATGVAVTTPHRRESPSAATETVAAPAAQIDRVRTAERVQKRLTALAALDHDGDRAQLLVEDIAKAQKQSRVDLLISELDAILRDGQLAAERATVIARVRADLEALVARIVDVDGEPADAVRRQVALLIATDASAIPGELSAAVDQLVAAADAEADRHHVVASMQRALEQLGYVLGPEFETQLESDRGTAIVGSPMAGYGVKVRMEHGSNRFTAQAVKSDAVITSAEKDMDVERAFCGDFEEMVTIVRGDGIQLDIDIDVQPGATAVQEVAAEHVAASGRPRAQRRSVERERQQS